MSKVTSAETKDRTKGAKKGSSASLDRSRIARLRQYYEGGQSKKLSEKQRVNRMRSYLLGPEAVEKPKAKPKKKAAKKPAVRKASPAPAPEVAPDSHNRRRRRRAAFAAGVVFFTGWIGGAWGALVNGATGAVAAGLVDAGFVVAHVHVTGLSHQNEAELRRQLMVNEGEPIFAVNLKEARERVEALDWVADAEVIRLLPNRLVVRVTERRPVAVHARDGMQVVVGADAEVILTADPAAFPTLPVVRGTLDAAAAADLAEALARRPHIAAQAQYFERQGGRRWDLITHDRLIVLLPEGPADAALARLDAVDAALGALAKGRGHVDLRGPGLIYTAPSAQRGA